MTAKEWLMRARKQEERIIALQGSKQRAYDRAVSTTARPREVCIISGGKTAPDEKNAAYIELCEEIDRQIDELNRIRTEILHACRAIQDNVLATLLIDYYVNGKVWEQIAMEQHYTWRHTMRLHGKALRKIEEVIQCHIHT